MKKKILAIALGLLLTITLVAVGCPAPAPPAPTPPAPAPPAPEPIKLIYTSYTTETHALSIAFKEFAKRVTERTNERVTFDMYFAGALGKAKEVLPYVRDGVADIAMFWPAYYPGLFNLVSAPEVPYSGALLDARLMAFYHLMEEFPELVAEFPAQNVKFLMPGTFCSVALATDKRVESVADLKGVKVRAVGYQAVVVEAWGMVPVSLSIADMYEAKQKGVIDAIFGVTPGGLGLYAIEEVTKYWIDAGTGGAVMLFTVMNLDSYNKLPPDIQKIFLEEAKAITLSVFVEAYQEKVRTAIVKAIEGGVKVYALSDELKAELEALAKERVRDKWVRDRVEAGISEELARKVLERYGELYRQYEPKATFKDFVEVYEMELRK